MRGRVRGPVADNCCCGRVPTSPHNAPGRGFGAADISTTIQNKPQQRGRPLFYREEKRQRKTHRPRTPPKTTRSVPMIAAECPDRAVGDLPEMAGGYRRSMSGVVEQRGSQVVGGVRK